jgi:hypothetical protein
VARGLSPPGPLHGSRCVLSCRYVAIEWGGRVERGTPSAPSAEAAAQQAGRGGYLEGRGRGKELKAEAPSRRRGSRLFIPIGVAKPEEATPGSDSPLQVYLVLLTY